jgi:drug/metabolite transporter (DMT)-like permease
MGNAHDENPYTTSNSWETAPDVEPSLKNSKVLWPKMNFRIFTLAYAGVTLLFIVMVALFILAIYLDNHGHPAAGAWVGMGAFACVAAAICWVWYFFNDKNGY